MMTRRPVPKSAATQARIATGWDVLLGLTSSPRGPASKITASLIAPPLAAEQKTTVALRWPGDSRSTPHSDHSPREAEELLPSRHVTLAATWRPSLAARSLLPPG